MSKVVGHDIVRALGRQHNPEQLHLGVFRKAFKLDQLALRCFTLAPGKQAGSRLYTHSHIDYSQLFELAHSLKGDFIMTYANEPSAIELENRHGFDIEAVAMKNTHHAQMTELVIGRNLDWLRVGKQAPLKQHAFAL